MHADGTASDPMQEPIVGFVLPVLAAWRLTHLLWAEDGPWNLIANLRRWLADHGIRVFDCFYCLSLWIAALLAFAGAESLAIWLLDWLAISGAAILLERLTAGNANRAAVWRVEPPSDSQDQ